MKRLLVLALVCLAVVSCKKDDEDDDNVSNHCGSNYTCVPDTAFEQKLIDFGYDNVMDGKVLTANISSVDSLDVTYENISDLTGIEDFTALTHLTCWYNQLTSLDVSNNTALTYLSCGVNELTSLDVSQNTALTYLNCQVNQLTSLDVSQNTDLTSLKCYGNSIYSLDLSNNTALTYLDCSGNIYLNCLNVKNGANGIMTTFIANYNESLRCIEVDDPAWANQYWTLVDSGVTFSTNCNSFAPCF